MRATRTWLAPFSGLMLVLLVGRAAAADPDPAEVRAAVEKAAAYLKARQNEDGSFAPKLGGPGVTALVAAALIRCGTGPDDPVVAKALRYLESNVQPDGGVYSQRLANYTT